MSVHSNTRCWLHLIWGTHHREKMFSRVVAAKVSRYLDEYAKGKEIRMKINFVNADHVHALIDLPTHLSIEEVVQLLKGSSAHWINAGKLIPGKFAWGRGYAAFSVSESNVKRVAEYIAGQEEHHRVKAFSEELEEFFKRHGVQAREV